MVEMSGLVLSSRLRSLQRRRLPRFARSVFSSPTKHGSTMFLNGMIYSLVAISDYFNGGDERTCSFVSLALAAETQTPSLCSVRLFKSYETWIHHVSKRYDLFFSGNQ
jgi:hypothetical protein